MNRSGGDKAAFARSDRFREAAVGFAITVAPMSLWAFVQVAMLSQLVGRIEAPGSALHAEAVSILRRDWLVFHFIAIGLVGVYWLVVARFGRANFLRRTSANVTLALFMLSLLSFTAYGSLIGWPDQMKGICSFLGVSDTYPRFGFDVQSSCDVFVQKVHITIIFGLLGLAVLLLVASGVLRIASPRTARLA
jgi:hypothetical protein